MKKIFFSLLAILITFSTASANWKETFLKDYSENGLNPAVMNALSQGIAPETIIETAMTIEGVNGAMVATAICDGGVPVNDLLNSLDLLGINRQTAIQSCGAYGNVSASTAFPGSNYSSPGKEIIFTDYTGIISGGDSGTGDSGTRPASGHDFSR